MNPERARRYQLITVLLVLVVLQFALRPLLGDHRIAPDFLLLALLVYAIRARPGAGAVAGFVVGLLSDALTPTAFGSGMLAHTCVGYLAAWGKAIFFAENLLVAGGFVFVGTVIRGFLVLLWGGHVQGASLMWHLTFWTPLLGITTAVVGVAVFFLFRGWLEVRIGQ